MGMCENCKYRLFLANAYDMHIDSNDCDKVNTHFCEKMQKPDTTVIIDAGCTDKTMYRKGYKDALASIVHCQDCKYWLNSLVAPGAEHSHGYCHIEESDDVVVGRWDDDFCSYGERKDNE